MKSRFLSAAVILLGGALPALAEPVNFDAAWTSYFGPEYFVYAAIKNPRIDGPLMHSPLDSDPANVPAAAKANNPMQFMRAFLEDAKKDKIVEKNYTELVAEGFAMGVAAAPDQKEPAAALFVAPKSQQLIKFDDWVIAAYQKKFGPGSTESVKIEGLTGTKFLKTEGKSQPVLIVADNVVLLGTQEATVAAALKRAKDKKDTIADAKYYKRSRARVGADAAMFVMINPMPIVALIEQSAKGPKTDEQQKKIADAKQNLAAVDSVLLTVGADKAASHVEMSIVLDPASPQTKSFKLLAALSGVKAAGFASASTPAFLGIVRPADLTAGVAEAHRESITQQLTSMKGMLQVQTGLEFDKDVAPWWGSEVGLMLHVPEAGGGAPPEGALVFDSKDPKAAQEAIDKVIRHVGVAQNKTFVDRKVGEFTMKTAEPPPGGQPSPVNISLALANGYVVLGTGPTVIDNALSDKNKLSGTPGYQRINAAITPDKLGLVLYLKTDVLVKAQAGAPQAPNSPGAQVRKLAEDVDSIVLGLGWPDDESLRIALVFNGK